MKINVKAKSSAREDKVERVDEVNFIVSVKSPPVKGMANEAICGLLAEFFNISKSQVKIVSGYTSRSKIIEVSI